MKEEGRRREEKCGDIRREVNNNHDQDHTHHKRVRTLIKKKHTAIEICVRYNNILEISATQTDHIDPIDPTIAAVMICCAGSVCVE